MVDLSTEKRKNGIPFLKGQMYSSGKWYQQIQQHSYSQKSQRAAIFLQFYVPQRRNKRKTK